MGNAVLELALIVSVIVLILLNNHSLFIQKQIENYPARFIRAGLSSSDYANKHGPINSEFGFMKTNSQSGSNSTNGLFSIIIVTYNEPLLYKTYVMIFEI